MEGWALDAAVVAGAVGLATLSFWLVEEPIRTGNRPAGLRTRRVGAEPGRVPRYALSGLALLVVIGIIIGTSAGAPKAPGYTSVSDKEVLNAALGHMTPAEEAKLRRTTSTTVPIDQGPPGPFTGAAHLVVDPSASVDPGLRLGRPLHIMVAGDSVGWSIAWGLKDQVTPSVKVQDRAVIGCGLMPPDSKYVVDGHPPKQYGPLCQQADLVELKGLSNHPDAVLLWVGAWEVYDHQYQGLDYRVGTRRYATFLEQRLQMRVDRYRGIGAGTLLPVVPCFAPNAAALGDDRLKADRVDWINARVRAVADRNPGWVRLIDPESKLCDPSGHALAKTPTGISLREDGSHFDPPAAIWFWNTWLAGQFGAAFDIPKPTTTTTIAPSTSTSTSAPTAHDTTGG